MAKKVISIIFLLKQRDVLPILQRSTFQKKKKGNKLSRHNLVNEKLESQAEEKKSPSLNVMSFLFHSSRHKRKKINKDPIFGHTLPSVCFKSFCASVLF